MSDKFIDKTLGYKRVHAWYSRKSRDSHHIELPVHRYHRLCTTGRKPRDSHHIELPVHRYHRLCTTGRKSRDSHHIELPVHRYHRLCTTDTDTDFWLDWMFVGQHDENKACIENGFGCMRFVYGVCEKCVVHWTHEMCEMVEELPNMEHSVEGDVKYSLVFIAGYVIRKDKEVVEDSCSYFEKFGTFTLSQEYQKK
ncbi:hypothetical protein PoB_001257800 [Plakobranchus ocellatus]|uniref:Uncharacterized protein n=1 Tax=Plakobranchus ocellatus TaxID=259542 RepID=A0AAV3YU45_9GAST|nr:hypothetical protein PoB_001257800 [Plakobranchus ocellatus]